MYMEGDMSEGTVPKRQYTEEFRLEAVRLADAVGGHEAASRLGIPIATPSNWRRRKAPGAETTEPASDRHARQSPTDLEAENSRLRKELASAGLAMRLLDQCLYPIKIRRAIHCAGPCRPAPSAGHREIQCAAASCSQLSKIHRLETGLGQHAVEQGIDTD